MEGSLIKNSLTISTTYQRHVNCHICSVPLTLPLAWTRHMGSIFIPGWEIKSYVSAQVENPQQHVLHALCTFPHPPIDHHPPSTFDPLLTRYRNYTTHTFQSRAMEPWSEPGSQNNTTIMYVVECSYLLYTLLTLRFGTSDPIPRRWLKFKVCAKCCDQRTLLSIQPHHSNSSQRDESSENQDLTP